jgi:hypothetical protein
MDVVTAFIAGDHAISLTNALVVVASLHVAHRSLPEEKKHWIKDRVRQVKRAARRKRNDDR